jgi:hypothetical protein
VQPGRAVEEGGVTKNSPMTIEEMANRMSAAAARAAKGLREVSDAIAEFREAETMLKGLAASQTIAAENRERANGATFARPISERLAYSIPEIAQAWRQSQDDRASDR